MTGKMRDANDQNTTCPNAETLTRCVLGRLPPDQHELVTAHVNQCARCQDTIRDVAPPCDEFVESLRIPLARDGFEEEEECATSVSRVEGLLAEALNPEDQPTVAMSEDPSDESQAIVTQGVSSSASGTEAPANAFIDPGQLGPYRLLEKLGEGGMGAVYKALHTKLDRVVAVKVLGKTRLNDADAVARFEREMKAVGRLQHPHIVHATDADEDNGVHYLVMELVVGIDLSRLGRRLAPLPVAEACELIRQAAVGLQYVHEHGLVHRDIKPSNLMLSVIDTLRESESRSRSERPTLKILDLGLALLDAESGEGELTSTGRVMGTIDYMPPEQFENTHGVDIRADIYSLGATLYKLLTSHAPFSGEKYGSSLKKIAALARDEAPSVSTHRNDLPPKLVAIIDRMLARNPSKRFQTPGEAADALTPFAEGADLVALWGRAESVPESSPNVRRTAVAAQTVVAPGRPRRTKSIVVWIAALAVIAGAAVWATSRFLVRDEPSVARQPKSLVGQPSDVHSSDSNQNVERPSPRSTDAAADFDAGRDMVTLPNGWQIGKPVRLGPPINSESGDFNPTLSADGLTIIFGSHRTRVWDALWTSNRAGIEQPWNEPVRLNEMVAESADLSGDGLTIVLSAKSSDGGDHRDLWMCTRRSREHPFGPPENLGTAINSSHDEAGPSLSDDGLTLLFASGRPGGHGDSDIWMSTRPSKDQPWAEAVNLGSAVNSIKSDGGPDLSADGLAMVFESRREVSHGVGDLWMSTRQSIDLPWGEPVNLGAEVNSSTWDAEPTFAADDTLLYYSTRQPNQNDEDRGNANIWRVPVKRPESPTLPDGLVISAMGWELAHVYRNAKGIEGIAFDPRDGKLYTGGLDHGICRFEDSGPVKAMDRAASSPAFAADGESIYCVDYGKTTLTQVDCDSAAAIRTINSRDAMSFIFRLAPSPSRFKGSETRAGDLLVSEAGPGTGGALRRFTTDGEEPVTLFESPDGDYVYDFCFGSHDIYLIRAYLPMSEGFDATRLKQTLCRLDDGKLVTISTDEPLDSLGAIVFDHVTSDLLVACWETNRILRVRLDEQGLARQVSTVLEGFKRVAGGGMAISLDGRHLAIHDLESHTIYAFSRSATGKTRN